MQHVNYNNWYCLGLLEIQMVDEKLKALEHQNLGKDSQILVAIVRCGYSGVELVLD